METTAASSFQIWKKVLFSSVGKKYLMALTGMGLTGFILTHLLANLLLLLPDGKAFNAYAAKLADLGPGLLVLEAGLVFCFGVHIVNGVYLALQARQARPSRYQRQATKGGPSRWNLSSATMPITGMILFVFLIIHVSSLKFGPAEYQGYTTIINGRTVRDLHRLVIERFQNPLNVIFYVGVMLMLFSHLRHGFWSAFQSLGANHPRYMPLVRCLGVMLSILLSVGFLVIPVYLWIAR